jgi:hypothetical protein
VCLRGHFLKVNLKIQIINITAHEGKFSNTLYPISESIVSQEALHKSLKNVGLDGSFTIWTFLGEANGLYWVRKLTIRPDIGPAPSGPTIPTSKMKDSQASSWRIEIVKSVVVPIGPGRTFV